MKCVVTVTLTLLAFVGLNEAYYNPPAPLPLSIRQLLTCIGAPIRNRSREDIPVIPLVPAPAGQPWLPLNGTVPLYHENYDTIISDMDLRDRLIEHLGDEYATMTEPITYIERLSRLPLSVNIDRDNDLLNPPGCPIGTIAARFPNVTLSDITTQFIENWIQCQPTFRFGERIPYFFPPLHTEITCGTPPGGTYCSVPIGATCVYDLNCLYNMPALMWDCCWTWDQGELTFIYECGWRRVRVPIGTRCSCEC